MIKAPRPATIAEGDIAQFNRTTLGLQFDSTQRIGQLMRWRQGLHGIFDLAYIGVDTHQRETDPAGHLRKTQRNGAGSGNITRRRGTDRPEIKRGTHQQHGQQPAQPHQPEPERRRQPAEMHSRPPISFHRIGGGAVLECVMGEQFDRLDIGDRIDDLPRHHRAFRGTRLRPRADARHIEGDQPDISQYPERQHTRSAVINRQQQNDRPDKRGQRIGNRLDHIDHEIRRRPRALHLFLRDPPREIIVKERDRLAQRMPVQPRQH